MAAYIGAQLDVNNTDWQQEYGPKAGALVQKRGGKSACGGWVHARAPRRQGATAQRHVSVGVPVSGAGKSVVPRS